MNKLNLNYINSDVLEVYDIEKHYGLFVYLRKDYKEYPFGLYVGGIEGWERLTNDIFYLNPTDCVPVPIPNRNEFIYDGKEKTYLPLNWEEIKEYCYITGNIQTEVGDDYDVIVYLKNPQWKWSDGTNSEKHLSFTIKSRQLGQGEISAKLSSDYSYYGDEFPTVEYVIYDGEYLEEGKDYVVEYPSDGNVGKKNVRIRLVGNYSGYIDKQFEIRRKPVPFPEFSSIIFEYTGYEVIVFPDNWDEIGKYCIIHDNTNTEVGKYVLFIELKPNYCWENGSMSIVTQEYRIEDFVIPIPVWDTDDVYDITYDGIEHEFFPLNWEEIKDFCEIRNNVRCNSGKYEITISLRNPNFKWSDGTKDDKIKKFVINPVEVDLPEGMNYNTGEYTGHPYEYYPMNWDDIKEWCYITNNIETEVGEYKAIVKLKNRENYVWKGTNGSNDDIYLDFFILKAKGYFILKPYIEGRLIGGNTLICECFYVDNMSQLTYEWYRSKTGSLDDVEYVGESSKTDDPTYVIQGSDVDYYIICLVRASDTRNYYGTSAYAVSSMKVSKIYIDGVFDFNPRIYEDSIPSSMKFYQLPGTTRLPDDDQSTVEFRIISGGECAELWDIRQGTLLIKGAGDVVIEAVIGGSDVYIYNPNVLRFILHIYSSDLVLWGLYEKEVSPNQKDDLENGIIPENAIVARLKENENGIHSIMARDAFPFRKESDSSEQCYHGWYVLIPEDKHMISIEENGGNSMNPHMLKLRDKDGNDIIYTHETGTRLKCYAKFSKAITSHNWLMYINFK